jgi:hypothetical protein
MLYIGFRPEDPEEKAAGWARPGTTRAVKREMLI